MKLTEQQIIDTLSSKGFTCDNLSEYQNLDTVLSLHCEKGHRVEASLRTVRHALFKCPFCEGDESISEKVSNMSVPTKEGYRIVAIDNATENAGVSIFDNGKLVYYHLFHFDGETVTRLMKNRKLLEDVIIERWQPDFIVVEDIQYQSNIQTFKVLAMLLGNTLVSIRKADIKYDTVYSKVWRSHFLIKGKTRADQKKEAIKKIQNMYNITVNDDVAEAILIGKYAVDCLGHGTPKKLF